jgi:hypothetical protein
MLLFAFSECIQSLKSNRLGLKRGPIVLTFKMTARRRQRVSLLMRYTVYSHFALCHFAAITKSIINCKANPNRNGKTPTYTCIILLIIHVGNDVAP